MLIMVCDLCGVPMEDGEVVEYGKTLVDACPRCVNIMRIAAIGHPAESAEWN